MSVLAIAQPLALAFNAGSSTPGGLGAANLLTPDPREAFQGPVVGQTSLWFDLPGPTAVDTFLLGYTNVAEGGQFQVLVRNPAGQVGRVWLGVAAHSFRRAPLRHCVAVLDQPVTAVAVNLVVASPGGLVAGVAAVGQAIRPNGHEWGGGRPVSDTTRVERLQGGGFGIEPGLTAGGWAWTMPGLTDEQRERLYALQLDVGTGGTMLVVEDPDAGPALNERVHWGLLTRLEPFARQAPDEAKWAMQVQDWC